MASDGAPASSRIAVIRVLVAAMGDSARSVQEAAASALCEIARQNAEAVLDCCAISLRAGKRVVSYRAGLLLIMAYTVREMSEEQVNSVLMRTTAKLAMTELSANKEGIADWRSAASNLLVAVGSRLPDVLMDETFNQLAGGGVPVVELVQTLAEFATACGLLFAPRFKHVLSRVLPILSGVRDNKRLVFAKAFSVWCETMNHCHEVCASNLSPDGDLQALLYQAFELMLDAWITSQVDEVRLETAEALGKMMGLVSRSHLSSALPRLLPSILAVCRKEKENPLPATSSLHTVLFLILVNDGGSPMIDFLVIPSNQIEPDLLSPSLAMFHLILHKIREYSSAGTVVFPCRLSKVTADHLHTWSPALDQHTSKIITTKLLWQALAPTLNVLLPKAYLTVKSGSKSTFSSQMKNHNEVLRCFVTIRMAYPSEIFNYLLHQIRTQENWIQLGTLSVWKHLIIRHSELWFFRRGEIAEAVKYLLQKRNLKMRKSVAELIVCMASSGFLDKDTSEVCIEFLVKQCALSDTKKNSPEGDREFAEKPNALEFPADILMEKEFGRHVSSQDVKRVCKTGLLLLAGTVLAAEVVLWPFLLKMLMPGKYTVALGTVCKCITEILKHKISRGEKISVDYTTSPSIPQPEELLARLLVLLQYPLEAEVAPTVLIILDYLGPIFPTAVVLLWEVQIPKMKACTNDINVASWQQTTWEDMMIHLLAEVLGVVHDMEWIMSFGNALAAQYDLYREDQQIALLHRCMGTVLQKVDNEVYVQQMIALMYQRANLSNETNREGLASAMGLVASAHLDAVLRKLQRILDSQKRNGFRRVLSRFAKHQNPRARDDVFATLSLMYGYAASYAPSSGIEARIETLVGSDMLKGLLKVKAQSAKQAVVSSINLLGQAVIKAAKKGTSFPLKKRDAMLNYIISLMGAEEKIVVNLELLHTQEMALNACTTLVSVDPKLTPAMRDSVLQTTFGFFTLPSSVAMSGTLFGNLTNFLCTILRTSGDDGRGRATQLQILLKRLDQYAFSPKECERERAVRVVLALLHHFWSLYAPGNCSLGCSGSCKHLRSTADAGNPALLPPREVLRLGERVMSYLPRCNDTSPAIRTVAAQIIATLCTIVLLIPDPVGAKNPEDSKALSLALSALQDLTDTTKGETSEGEVIFLQHVIDVLVHLLNVHEVVAALKGCKTAMCDMILQSAHGAITAATQIIYYRGGQLRGGDVSRTSRILFEAATAQHDRHPEILAVMCSLAERSLANVVFSEIISAAEAEWVSDESKRKNWPVKQSILAVAHYDNLSVPFLEYVVDILDHVHVAGEDDPDHGNISDHMTLPLSLSRRPQAATLVLQEICRGANHSVKQAVNQCYPRVLFALLLRIGSIHETFTTDMQPLRDLVTTINAFAETVENDDMGKLNQHFDQVLFTDGEQRLSGERWTEAIEEIASFSSRERPEEVTNMCTLLWPALEMPQDCQRAAAAAALSGLVQHCEHTDALLGSLVDALSAHTSDESPTVRRLCVRGLVQMVKRGVTEYASQALNVIVALLEDHEDEVANAAVCGLSPVVQVVTSEAVAPMLLNLCVRLSFLQTRLMESTRAAAFEALGSLSKFTTGAQLDTFMEQIHKILPRLVFHVNDEAPSVSLACKNALKSISPLLHAQDIRALANLRTFDFGRSLEYDDFVKEFVNHAMLQFGDKVDIYISCAIQAFDSPWPVIQANSAYFAGCLLSQAKEKKSLATYLPQVSTLLVKMTANSPSALVRAKSTHALSLILNVIEVSTSC